MSRRCSGIEIEHGRKVVNETERFQEVSYSFLNSHFNSGATISCCTTTAQTPVQCLPGFFSVFFFCCFLLSPASIWDLISCGPNVHMSHLLFVSRLWTPQKPGIKAEGVDLCGAVVDWTTEKSSRKNVVQVGNFLLTTFIYIFFFF